MIQIDTESQQPLLDQIVEAMKGAIATGVLAPGQELPSARQLSGDLGIHWNTVARAYRALSDLGLIFVAHGRKTHVKNFEDRKGPTPAEKLEVRNKLRDTLTQARLIGLDTTQVKALFMDELENWKRK